MSNELTKAFEIIRNLSMASKVKETIVTYDAIIGICAKLSMSDTDCLEELRGMIIAEAARYGIDEEDSRALRCFEQIIRIYQEE